MSNDKMREKFEEQCRGHRYSIKRASDFPDCYEQTRTQIAWQIAQEASQAVLSSLPRFTEGELCEIIFEAVGDKIVQGKLAETTSPACMDAARALIAKGCVNVKDKA